MGVLLSSCVGSSDWFLISDTLKHLRRTGSASRILHRHDEGGRCAQLQPSSVQCAMGGIILRQRFTKRFFLATERQSTFANPESEGQTLLCSCRLLRSFLGALFWSTTSIGPIGLWLCQFLFPPLWWSTKSGNTDPLSDPWGPHRM